jgi:dipeptidyl aminopeptidase/acylaminoacyl peptidase
MVRRALIGLAFLSCAFVSATSATSAALKLEDYLNLVTVGDPQISPDGKLVVFRRYAIDPSKDSEEGELWIMRADGKDARRLGDGWNARWSPQVGVIAFVATVADKPEIFVRTLRGPLAEDAGEPRRVTDDKLGHGSLAWSPDGKSIAFVASVPDERDPWPIDLPANPSGKNWSAGPQVVLSGQARTGVASYKSSFQHIFVTDVESGATRQITRGPWDVGAKFSAASFAGGLEWSLDSRTVFFDGWTGEESTTAALSSTINAVDVASGALRIVTTVPGFWRAPRLSPDGKVLAYTGSRASTAAFAPQDLHLIDIDGSNDRVIAHDLPDRVFSMEWAPDGTGVLISKNHNGATNLAKIGVDGSDIAITTGDHRIFLGSVSGATALGLMTATNRPSDVARIDIASGAVVALTDVNAFKERLAPVESFWVKSADGTSVQAWLVKPRDFSRRRNYPLILDIHGGPDAMGGFEFDFRHHEFASRGYLVLYLNPRGSTGYGSAFANAIAGGFPADVDAEDLEAGVDAVIARGYVDRDRVYVMGCSGGGSLAAWLTARSNRFAASVVMCAVTNWISAAGTIDATAWAYTRFAKPFWDDPESWIRHSPLMRVGQINTPTLIAVGARDARTPPTQSSELFTALRMRGVPARLLVFPNEGHGPWRAVPSDLMRLQLYVDDWFKSHRGRRAATAR